MRYCSLSPTLIPHEGPQSCCSTFISPTLSPHPALPCQVMSLARPPPPLLPPLHPALSGPCPAPRPTLTPPLHPAPAHSGLRVPAVGPAVPIAYISPGFDLKQLGPGMQEAQCAAR